MFKTQIREGEYRSEGVVYLGWFFVTATTSTHELSEDGFMETSHVHHNLIIFHLNNLQLHVRLLYSFALSLVLGPTSDLTFFGTVEHIPKMHF